MWKHRAWRIIETHIGILLSRFYYRFRCALINRKRTLRPRICDLLSSRSWRSTQTITQCCGRIVIASKWTRRRRRAKKAHFNRMITWYRHSDGGIEDASEHKWRRNTRYPKWRNHLWQKWREVRHSWRLFKLLCGTLLLRRLFRYLVLFNLVGRPYLLGRANFNASLLLDILLILLDGRAWLFRSVRCNFFCYYLLSVLRIEFKVGILV
jgi:hypothetical protein